MCPARPESPPKRFEEVAHRLAIQRGDRFRGHDDEEPVGLDEFRFNIFSFNLESPVPNSGPQWLPGHHAEFGPQRLGYQYPTRRIYG